MIATKIIAAIQDRCKELEIDYTTLADRSAISRKTLYNFLNEKHDLGCRKLDRIFDTLDLSLTVKPGKGRPVESELVELFKEEED